MGLNEKEVVGFAGATELPLLPEMSATWTRRQNTTRTPSGSSPHGAPDSPTGIDVIMSQSDATRTVTRNKCIRPLGSRPSTTPGVPTRARNLTRTEQQQLIAEVMDLKAQLEDANTQIARQQVLFLDASQSLQLVRDIFTHLRENWRLRLPEGADQSSKDV